MIGDHGAQNWTVCEEHHFLDFIGGWRLPDPQRLRMKAVGRLPERKRLKDYIRVYQKSPHDHHRSGVKYAGELLKAGFKRG